MHLTKQEMIHILTIMIREIVHAFNSQLKILCSARLPFRKGVNVVIIWGFLHFVFLGEKHLDFLCALW